MRTEALGAAPFGVVIEFLFDGVLQFAVDRLESRRRRAEQASEGHQAPQLAQVGVADRTDAGILDLHDQRPPLPVAGAVDLAQRRGRRGPVLNGFEQLIELAVVEPLQMRFQRGERQRRDLILQTGQRRADRRRQNVLPLRRLLAELEYRTFHLPQGVAQQRTDRCPVDTRGAGGDALHQQIAGDARTRAAQMQKAPQRRGRRS